MEQLSQSPFFPVPVRWFEIPMQTVRWGLGQLAQSAAAGPTAAVSASPSPAAERPTATRTDATVAAEAPSASAESSPQPDGQKVGAVLNEYA